MNKTSIVSTFHTFIFGFSILFLSSCQQNPLSETGYSTTDLNVVEFSYSGATGTTGSVRNPMSVAPTSLNDNGFAPTCSILPALPTGLSINPSTCVISGTPLSALPKTTYIVTAVNAAGLSKSNVVLNVVPSKPTISYTTGVGIVNQSFTHAPTLYHNDSAITGCTISPDLPDGFSLDPITCVITGQSSDFINSQTHSVTVTNGIGSTTTNVTFMIASVPILSYSGVSTAGSVGNAMSITPSDLDIQGAAVTSCTTSPALPSGLSINSTTCVISGTPTVTDSSSYTVTVTNGAGSSTESLSLNIVPSPPAISYSGVLGLGFVAIPFLATPSVLENNGAFITNCAPVGGLPTGLSVHPNTCVISGTPSGVSTAGPYTIRATNSAGYTDASFSISISPSAPTISYAGVSGGGVYNSSFTMAPSILNLNGAAIQSCTITPALPSGLTINNSTCAITGTPLALSPQTTYTVTAQNSAGSATVTLSLYVGGASLSFTEDGVAQTIPLHLPFGTTGALCSPLSFTSNSLVTTTISGVHPNCEASILPNLNQNGSGTLTLNLNSTPSPSSTLSFSITAVDDAPVANNVIATINEDVTTLVTLSYSDVENHSATSCTLSSLSNLTGTCSCSSGICRASITGTSNYYGSGSFNYTVTANNLLSNSASGSITINSVDDAPVASSINGTLTEDTAGVVNLSYTDVESHQATSCSLSNLSNLTGTCTCVSGSCVANVTGSSNFNGTASFNYTLTANGVTSTSASATVAVSAVNDAPVLGVINNQSTNEDVASTVTLSVTEVDESINCSSFVTATSSDTSLLPNANIAKAGTAPGCTLTLTPNLNQSGSTTITVTASDGTLSDVKTFTLTVSAVNDAPVISSIVSQSTNEDTSKAVSFTITDVDSTLNCSSSISVTSSSPVSSVTKGGTAPNCTLTVIPTADLNGSSSIGVTVSDGSLTASQSFTFTVTAVDDAPVASNISATINEDVATLVILSYSDVENHQGATCTISSLSNLTGTCACTSGICQATVTGSSNYNGSASFNYTVTANGVVSNTASATITVNAVNDAPVISSIVSQSTNEDTSKAVSFTITDVDSTLNCSSSISVTSSSPVSSVTKGGTAPNCTLTVIPIANLNGSSSISVTASDGSLSASQSFTFTVTAVDDAPVATNVSGTISEDVASSITLAYTDADSDKASACTLSSLSNLSGSCSCNASTGVCTAAVTGTSNYNGAASFSYTVTANGVVSNSATASVTITAVNDAPVLAAISAQTMTENNSLTVTLSVSDVDSSITCSSFISGASSNTTLLPNASISRGGSAPGCTITLTPATSQTGTSTITVTASDGSSSSVQTFTLTVNPNIVTIAQFSGYRGWSNGTFARTCYEYLNPTGIYQYSGSTGNSTYRIDPDGAGAVSPLDVTCDMANGGWTTISSMRTDAIASTSDSGELVTSNLAAFNAIAALSNLQKITYTSSYASGSTTVPGTCQKGIYVSNSHNIYVYTQNGSQCCLAYWWGNPTTWYCPVSGTYCVSGFNVYSYNERFTALPTEYGMYPTAAQSYVRLNNAAAGGWDPYCYNPEGTTTTCTYNGVDFKTSSGSVVSSVASGLATNNTITVGITQGSPIRKFTTKSSCSSGGANGISGTLTLNTNTSFTYSSAINIVDNGSYKAWSNGTVATSCNAYRNPTSPYQYLNNGNGIYRIDPDGAGATAPFNVYCDMTTDGGGWTLCLNSKFTANASALFTSSYSKIYPPAGDPLGYYDFCPQDSGTYLFTLADVSGGGYAPQTATLKLTNATPYNASGEWTNVGIQATAANVVWLTNPFPTQTASYTGVYYLSFFEYINPGYRGLKGFKRGFLNLTIVNSGCCNCCGNNIVMGSGCNYASCTSPLQWDTDIYPRWSHWTYNLTSTAGMGNDYWAIGPFREDRTQVYYR